MQIQNPTRYSKKWGFNIHTMATSWLQVIFIDIFLYKLIKLQRNEMQ